MISFLTIITTEREIDIDNCQNLKLGEGCQCKKSCSLVSMKVENTGDGTKHIKV